MKTSDEQVVQLLESGIAQLERGAVPAWFSLSQFADEIRSLRDSLEWERVREARLIIQQELFDHAQAAQRVYLRLRGAAVPEWMQLGRARTDGRSAAEYLLDFLEQLAAADLDLRHALQVDTGRTDAQMRQKYDAWLILKSREEKARESDPALMQKLRARLKALQAIASVAN